MIKDLFAALAGALQNVLHPRVLGVLLLPMLAALFGWLLIGWWFWDAWLGVIQGLIAAASDTGWIATLELSRFAGAAATVVLFLLLAPLVIVTAALIAAVLAMPVLVEHVARRDFPALERRSGGTVIGSVANAVIAIGGFAVMWVATLPAWLFAGPLAPLIPWLLSAWLNQRLFRYDAAAEHASAQELQRLFESGTGARFALGLATGLLYYIPVVNLIAPTFAALAFIRLELAALSRMRSGADRPA